MVRGPLDLGDSQVTHLSDVTVGTLDLSNTQVSVSDIAVTSSLTVTSTEIFKGRAKVTDLHLSLPSFGLTTFDLSKVEVHTLYLNDELAFQDQDQDQAGISPRSTHEIEVVLLNAKAQYLLAYWLAPIKHYQLRIEDSTISQMYIDFCFNKRYGLELNKNVVCTNLYLQDRLFDEEGYPIVSELGKVVKLNSKSSQPQPNGTCSISLDGPQIQEVMVKLSGVFEQYLFNLVVSGSVFINRMNPKPSLISLTPHSLIYGNLYVPSDVLIPETLGCLGSLTYSD